MARYKCVRSRYPHEFEVGKIYETEHNGRVRDDEGDLRLPATSYLGNNKG